MFSFSPKDELKTLDQLIRETFSKRNIFPDFNLPYNEELKNSWVEITPKDNEPGLHINTLFLNKELFYNPSIMTKRKQSAKKEPIK